MPKKIINKIDAMSGGLLRHNYRVAKSGASQFGNYIIRKNVSHTLGYRNYRKIGKLKLAFLPNELKRSNWNGGGYGIQKIFMALGVQPMPFNPFRTFDVFLNWQDLTCPEFDAKRYIKHSYEYTKAQLPQHTTYLNFECIDISKKRIGEVNMSVFGYSLDVDPTTFIGSVVCKSDENAAHDGQVIQCPIDISEVTSSKVYSIEIQNIEGAEVVDFRVPYMRGNAGFFYEKRRPLSSRFSNANTSVRLRKLNEEFSECEVSKIEKFCEELGADYGELDVLRDRSSGKIYIVDFAKTPFGPPQTLGRRETKRAIELMATAFARNILIPLI